MDDTRQLSLSYTLAHSLLYYEYAYCCSERYVWKGYQQEAVGVCLFQMKIQSVALAYRLYHYLKHNHQSEAQFLKRNRNLDDVLNIVLEAGLAIWRHNQY